jgi:hypothetical protein
VIFWVLYAWAPKDISGTPLGTLTLSDLISTAIFIAAVVFSVRALFSPIDNDDVKNAWGWFGIVILGGGGIGFGILV